MRTHRLPVTPRPIVSFKRHSMALGVRLSFSTITGLLAAGQASAQAPEAGVRYDIPAGPLDEALSRFAQQSGTAIVMDAAKLRSLSSSGLRGDYGVEEGFNRLLLGSGYTLGKTKAGYIVIEAPRASQGAATVLPAVKVEAQSDRLFDPPPEQGGFKADFQESATKTPLSIRETPQSISVVTRESMDRRQVRDVASALETAAGVSVLNGIPGSFAGSGRVNGIGLALRGQLLDSRRDIRTDGFVTDSLNAASDLALFERVEVVKGPSSSLYGAGSLSGFINRVSKRPQREPAMKLSALAGSFDTYRTEFDVTGGLDQNGNLDARLIAVYEDSGSFTDGVDTKRLLVAPSLLWRAGDRTQLLLQTHYQDNGGTPGYGFPLAVRDNGELVPPNIPRSRFIGKPGGEVDVQEYDASLRLDHQWTDRWLSTLLLQKGRVKNTTFGENYGSGLTLDGETNLYSGARLTDIETWAGELRLDGRFSLWGQEQQLVAGIEKRNLDGPSEGRYALIGTGNIYTDDFNAEPIPLDELERGLFTDLKIRTEAAYAQLALTPWARTRLIGAIRTERAEQFSTLVNPAVERPTPQGDSKSATTYRLGLSQDLSKQLTAFASYATSFVPITQRAADGTVLDPETGSGIEVGLKGEWADGRLATSVAAFRQERDKVPLNLSRDECTAGGAGLTTCARSAGSQEFNGIEVEISGKPLPSLTVGLAASWLDGEFTERSDPDFGRQAPNVVERQTNLFADYRWSSGPLTGFSSGASVVSFGDRNAPRVGQFAAGYERVDLHFGYDRIPHWNLSLLVRNLFDERYLEAISFGSGGFTNYFGSPRAALLRLEYRFDL